MTNTPTATLRTGHVGLNVTDLERSLDFYRMIFGFDIAARSDVDGRVFALLALDGQIVLTLWQQSRGTFSGEFPGLHHLAFQVDSIERVEEYQARVNDAGGQILHGGIVPHGEGMASGGVFFTDPDGIRVEIFAPSGADGTTAPTPGAPTCGFF